MAFIWWAGLAEAASSDGGVTASPDVGAGTWTGFAAAVIIGTVASPGKGAGTYTGFAPTVQTPRTVLAAKGAGAYAGFAPTVQVSIVVSAGKGAGVYAGLTPTIVNPHTVFPSLGTGTYDGFAPTITNNVRVDAKKGAGLYTGLAPTVQTPRTVRPSVGLGVYTGKAPTVQTPKLVTAALGTGTYTGLAPTIAVTNNVVVRPGVGTGTWVGLEPFVLNPQRFFTGTGLAVWTGYVPSAFVEPRVIRGHVQLSSLLTRVVRPTQLVPEPPPPPPPDPIVQPPNPGPDPGPPEPPEVDPGPEPEPEPEPGPPELPPSALLFFDDFPGGVRSAPQNGVSYGVANHGLADAIGVVTDLSNPSGFSLGFTFTGNASLADDAWSEQTMHFPDLTRCYIEFRLRIPDNYAHRDATGPDNDKLLRLYDEDYSSSVIHVGLSTLPRVDLTSQIIVEYKKSGGTGTGNYGLGPWTPVFTPGQLYDIGFEVIRASGVGVADGVIRVWVNNTLVEEDTDLKLCNSVASPALAANVIRNGYIMGWANSGFTETTVIKVQRIIVATERIEI